MEYLREINAFYDWLETNTLSANAVLTWHALMHTNNKCFWKKEFAVAISVLSLKTGGVSRRSIERARNELQQKGLITWRERAGSASAVYTMHSFVRHTDAQPVAQVVAQPVVQHDAQPVAQPVAITSYPTDTKKTNTKTKTKTKACARDALALLDPAVQDAMAEFIRARVKLKRPMTDKAISLAARKLRRVAGDDPARQVAVIERTLERGWLTFYPLGEEEVKSDASLGGEGPGAHPAGPGDGGDAYSRIREGITRV